MVFQKLPQGKSWQIESFAYIHREKLYENWRLHLKSSTSKKRLGANIDVNSVLLNYFFYSIEGYSKTLHHVLLDLKLRVNHIINCKNVYTWKSNRFSSFRNKLIRAWCKSGSRTPGPGTRDPSQSFKLVPWASLKFKIGTPGPPLKV